LRGAILQDVDVAVAAGARRAAAARESGVAPRTLERWRHGGEDRREGPNSPARNRLTDVERKRILDVAASPEHRDLSVKQIVPRLADRGMYVGSESSFYRVLRDEGQAAHRVRSRPPNPRRPLALIAVKPNTVWSWDITYLRSNVRGLYFRLYLVMDVFSRKIVGWSVHEEEDGLFAAQMIERAALAECVVRGELTLHADNGGPMKASTMLAKLEALGVATSFSRPRTSDDNPFSESLFRTLKYRPEFPAAPFESIDAARAWVARFVHWYNEIHFHSGIGHVTPASRHQGRDEAILAKRRTVYAAARRRNPGRWSGDVRDCERVGPVSLNPQRPAVVTKTTNEAAA
jgi:transposase InsO family protein